SRERPRLARAAGMSALMRWDLTARRLRAEVLQPMIIPGSIAKQRTPAVTAHLHHLGIQGSRRPPGGPSYPDYRRRHLATSPGSDSEAADSRFRNRQGRQRDENGRPKAFGLSVEDMVMIRSPLEPHIPHAPTGSSK